MPAGKGGSRCRSSFRVELPRCRARQPRVSPLGHAPQPTRWPADSPPEPSTLPSPGLVVTSRLARRAKPPLRASTKPRYASGEEVHPRCAGIRRSSSGPSDKRKPRFRGATGSPGPGSSRDGLADRQTGPAALGIAVGRADPARTALQGAPTAPRGSPHGRGPFPAPARTFPGPGFPDQQQMAAHRSRH